MVEGPVIRGIRQWTFDVKRFTIAGGGWPPVDLQIWFSEEEDSCRHGT
jgi:hypothetical protein